MWYYFVGDGSGGGEVEINHVLSKDAGQDKCCFIEAPNLLEAAVKFPLHHTLPSWKIT